jgi:hypothetical protein
MKYIGYRTGILACLFDGKRALLEGPECPPDVKKKKIGYSSPPFGLTRHRLDKPTPDRQECPSYADYLARSI